MPRKTSRSERLLLLTLSLEQALVAGDWESVGSHLAERDQLISELENGDEALTPEAKTRIEECNQRMVRWLDAEMKNVSDAAARDMKANRSLKAYQSSHRSAAYDRAS